MKITRSMNDLIGNINARALMFLFVKEAGRRGGGQAQTLLSTAGLYYRPFSHCGRRRHIACCLLVLVLNWWRRRCNAGVS